jgi:hypothetical protein
VDRKSIAVIGGGFFGLNSASYLADLGLEVSLFERQEKGMQSASLVNQARVHGGYHYPRALKTGARCRINFEKFQADFPESIERNFKSLYAIARNSRTTSSTFVRFCKLIGAPIKPASRKDASLFSSNLIESIWEVNEVSFNAVKLYDAMLSRLVSGRVNLFFGTQVINVFQDKESVKVISLNGQTQEFDYVFISTYGENLIVSENELKFKELFYEVCEVVRVEPPSKYSKIALTVMDGPFWSLTPWPAFGEHALTHVRHTPHAKFHSFEQASDFIGNQKTVNRSSLMIRDAARFCPDLVTTKVIDSHYVVKTISNQRDIDDGRPILIQSKGRILSIVGSKIDNIYDIRQALNEFLRR